MAKTEIAPHPFEDGRAKTRSVDLVVEKHICFYGKDGNGEDFGLRDKDFLS